MALCIFGLSSLPGTTLRYEFFAWQDKLAHFLAYGLLAFLTARAFRRSRGWRALTCAAVASALMLAYGVLDEIHQSFVPYRNPDVLDVTADLAGALTACGLWIVLAGRERRLARSA
ncbi:MAG: VanZ family protein [Deltaproteobacteria bacterium]|nr:VanZ family protein [Deltaproteobacteria bacterium]